MTDTLRAGAQKVEELRSKVPRTVPLQVTLGLIVVAFALGAALGTKLVPPKVIEKPVVRPCPPLDIDELARASAEIIRTQRLIGAESKVDDVTLVPPDDQPD